MPVKAMASVLAFVAGEAVNVSAVCRDCGISRKTFYKYAARCRVEGVAGLEPRSTRPQRSPQIVAADVEEAVVELRKRLSEEGLDHGATTIQWHLGRDARFRGRRVPSVATVHRILVRRGFVTPQPRKRPKSSWRRFEASTPNEWWQIDATAWPTCQGMVEVFNIVDDHSRLACRSRAVVTDSSEEAWTTFCEAAQVWGLPAGVLSDNGLCFSGKLRGFEVLFEARLRDAGVRPITGRPYHPQTTGKVERFQQTLKRWLRHHDRRHGLAADLVELQARLDHFVDHYNHHRPHQGIGRATPHQRWMATAAAGAADPLPHPRPRAEPHPVTVTDRGTVRVERWIIAVGSEWAHCPATVVLDDRYATVFADHHLVRHLKLDPTRSYQPNGRRRGGPRLPRHLTS